RHGATVEEMTIEVNKKAAAQEGPEKHADSEQFPQALKRSVETRLMKWHKFRHYISLRCKVYFSYHVSNRGYYGKVLFDHINSTLKLSSIFYPYGKLSATLSGALVRACLL
ncbi:hypothetical protein B0H21DRAFT_688832, partial [Amylocystis lapponica]